MPHIHEKIDFTATAYIVHKNTVLLRMHDKYKMWTGVGGHIELDEDPNQAVIREIQEEVGLSLSLDKPLYPDTFPGYQVLVPPDFMNMHKIADGSEHKHMDMIYFVRSDSTDVVPSGSDQSQEWKWFSIEDIEDPQYNLREVVKFYAKSALKRFNE